MNAGSASVLSGATVALAVLVGLAACAPTKAMRTDATRGQALFMDQCAACHGADAKGAGTASLGLGVAPPDLTGISRTNGGVFPRDRVMSIIDGYYRREHFNDPMPVFGEQDLGPLVQVEENGISTPIPADLIALATYLESVQAPAQ